MMGMCPAGHGSQCDCLLLMVAGFMAQALPGHPDAETVVVRRTAWKAVGERRQSGCVLHKKPGNAWRRPAEDMRTLCTRFPL